MALNFDIFSMYPSLRNSDEILGGTGILVP